MNVCSLVPDLLSVLSESAGEHGGCKTFMLSILCLDGCERVEQVGKGKRKGKVLVGRINLDRRLGGMSLLMIELSRAMIMRADG
jgi:hypothetical protein